MKYGAVTFDTQVVHTNSFDFDSGLLNKLKTLRHDPIQVIVSDVVRSEILQHLTHHSQQILSQLDTALKKARDFGIWDTVPPAFGRDAASKIAVERFRDYLGTLNATIIPSGSLTAADVMKLYFQGVPPFRGRDKKAEFPDAVALMSVERWGRENARRVLAISGDADWQAFGETSDIIDVVGDIAAAMDALNEQADEARRLAGQALDKIVESPGSAYVNRIARLIDNALDALDFDAEAESFHSIESEQARVRLDGFRLVDVEDFELIVAEEDRSAMTVVVSAVLNINAESDFYLSTYDSIDKEDVSVGAVSASTTQEMDVRLMLTIEHDDGEFMISHVEIVEAPSSIAFGFVSPDYRNDYWDDDEEEPIEDEVDPQSQVEKKLGV